MSNNIVTFAGANLPSVKDLSTALRSIEAEIGPAGTVIIKMDKTGHWVFGADQTEIEDESTWAINPLSFVHGYIAWGDGEVLGEKMVSVSQPLPELEPAPPNAKKGWETQVGMSIKCISGEDKGLEARYTTTSVGGKRSVQTLAVAIAAQVDKDQSKPVPIVMLGKEHYTHKSYGRIFTPVFDIQEWVGMDGDAKQAEPNLEVESNVTWPMPEPAKAEEIKSARRRRSAV
jgi:hypothetical protein